MVRREASKRAGRSLAALCLDLPQEGIGIALHLGDTAATADVNGLPLDSHGNGWPHAAERLTRDRTGLLPAVRTRRRRGRRKGSRRRQTRGRLTGWGRGRTSGRILSSLPVWGQGMAWGRAPTATAATATAAPASTALAAAAGQQRCQRNGQERTHLANECRRPCHDQTLRVGAIRGCLRGARVALFDYLRPARSVCFSSFSFSRTKAVC
jgi:hypothetical protein